MEIPTAGHNRENDWRRKLAAAIWTATGIVAVVVISRRFSGHFSNGLPVAATISIVAALTSLNLLAAGLLQAALGKFGPRRLSHWSVPFGIGLLTLASPLMVGVSISQADSVVTRFSLVAMFVAAAAFMFIARNCLTFPVSPQKWESGSENGDPLEKTQLSTHTLGVSRDELLDEIEQYDSLPLMGVEAVLPEGQAAASQWMSRTNRPDGTERIEGTATLRFSAGQQAACIHVPFFPPFEQVPHVTCHLLEGHLVEDRPVRLRVTSTQPYGTRVEAKRTSATDDEEVVVVGYLAVSDMTQSKVA